MANSVISAVAFCVAHPIRVESAAMEEVTQAGAFGLGLTCRRLGNNLLLALATGYILFVFSERIFWTVWRPNDVLAEQVITWLAYSVAAYLFLAAVSWFRANDVWSIFLAGALYGWTVEGGIIYTLYGTEASAPFPLSISITGLSWHALISVMLGWWATGRALTATSLRPLVLNSLAIGIFWGVWAMFPRRETPPILTPVPAFLANAGMLTLGLMASWWLSFRSGRERFRPGRFGVGFCVIIIGLFFSQHVIKLGSLPLIVFPSVLCAALIPLSFHCRYVLSTSTAGLVRGSYRPRRLTVLGLIPIVATIVYWLATVCQLDRLPIATIVYYALTGPGGLLMLILAMFISVRKGRVATVDQ